MASEMVMDGVPPVEVKDEMIANAATRKRSPETGDLSLQVVMVAGARNYLNLEFAWAAA